jgi:hypothetical protein
MRPLKIGKTIGQKVDILSNFKDFLVRLNRKVMLSQDFFDISKINFIHTENKKSPSIVL